MSVAHEGSVFDVRLPLLGDYQAANALVAAGLAIAAGETAGRVLPRAAGLKGVKGRLEIVGERAWRPRRRRLRAQARGARGGARRAAPVRDGQLDLRLRLRRRPRQGQAPDHGRDRRRAGRRRRSSPTTIRAASAPSDPRRDPGRRARRARDRRPRRGDPCRRCACWARATCSSSPARATKPARSSAIKRRAVFRSR